MANNTSSRREPLVVFFSSPDTSRSDADAKLGELTTPVVSDELDPVLRRHITGDCSDAVGPRPDTLLPFNDFQPPRLQFEALPAPLPGYSATADAFPTFTLTVSLSDEERETLTLIMSGEGARLAESRRQALFSKLGTQLLPECRKIHETTLRAHLFMEPFTLVYALRFADGSTLFHSDPMPLVPDDGAWRLEMRRCVITASGATLTLSLLRRPCRLQTRLLEAGDMRTSAGGGVVGVDIFSTPDHSAFPDSEGELVHSADDGTNGYAWVFADSDRERRHASLSDPTGYRLMAFLPLRDLPESGEWTEVAVERDMSLLPSSTIVPDWFHRMSGEGRLIYSTVTQRLLADPRFKCPEPWEPLPTLDSTFPATLLLRLTVGLRVGGRLHLLSRLLDADEASCWLVDQDTPQPFPSLFHPMEECELIALECASSANPALFSRHLLFPMRPLSCGGSGWTRIDGDAPTFEDGTLDARYPDAMRGDLADWRLEAPGELLCSSDVNPVHYPVEGRFRASSQPLTGGVDFSGRKSGIDLPVVLFTAEGIRLCGREEVKCGGRTLRLWRPGEYLSTFTALSSQTICPTRQGAAFLTSYGVCLQTQTTVGRLSSRGIAFASDGALFYHPEVSLLEFRASGERNATEGERCVSWWYDLELDRELGSLTAYGSAGSDPGTAGSSGDGGYSRTELTTRPFRLPAAPSGIRLIHEDGVGTPPDGLPGAALRLDATADLRAWAPLGARRGLEIESLIPFPASPVWYRLRITLPPSGPSARGFIIDF